MPPRSLGRATLVRRRALRLVAAAPPALALASCAPTAGGPAARIGVDAGREVWRVPRGLRGFNFWGTRSDAAFFDEYRAIGVGMLRFPPGRTGDENDLSEQLMNESGGVASALAADLVVEVRLRGGTPERAAANVRHMNLTKRFGARYWEVGNEPDIYGRRAGEPEFTPQWYAERFRAFAVAMKAVDPSIKVFGPVLSNKLDEWMPPFIRACGDVADGLSWHFYGGNNRLPEADLLASTARFDRQVAQVRGWWRDPALNPRGAGRDVPLLISEYGPSYDSQAQRNLVTHAAALWTADMLGHLLVNRIDLAAYFTLWGIGYHGVWDRRGTPQPAHSVFRLFNEFGDRLLHAESDQPLLPAYAAWRGDGALSLLVINKSPDTAYRAAVEVRGARPAGPVQVWRHIDGAAATLTPYAGPLAPLDVTFPPYSTTLLVIPAEPGAPALMWGMLSGAAALAGALALRRRRRRGAR